MPQADHSADARTIAQWLVEAKRAVVFTGAGVSTESGIPDFRSPGGVWSRFRTVYFDEFLADADARHEYWRQKSLAHAEFAAAEPNVGHTLLAEWERTLGVQGVITQNIDGLHQIAGSQSVLELHGTARRIRCLDCHATYEADPLVAEFLHHDRVPQCPDCTAGRLKHATVSFGQTLPSDVLEEAAEWCRDADLMLTLGSSLVVSPAADLPVLAHRSGARIVIINRDPTPLDSVADVVVHGALGETLQKIHSLI